MKSSGMTFCFLTISMLVSGCATIDQVQRGNPEYTAVYPEPPSRASTAEGNRMDGGLYNQRTAMNLYDSLTARRVGDVLTITMNELTQAISESSTETQKQTNSTIESPSVLGRGLTPDLIKNIPFPLNPVDGSVNLSSTTQFQGQGDAEQRSNLIGNISVSVAEVMSNGNLVVRGEKWIQIGTNKEYFRLKGIVRPQDIRLDNTVQSQKVADVQIIYSNAGQNQQNNIMGILTKFFTSALWLL